MSDITLKNFLFYTGGKLDIVQWQEYSLPTNVAQV